MILLTGWLRLLSVEAFIVSCSFYKIIIVVLWLPRYIKSRCCLPVRLGNSMRQLDGVLWHISRMSITGEGGGDPCTPGLAPDPGRGALCSLQSYCTHGREKEQQFWVCNYEDWDGNIPRFLLLSTSPYIHAHYTGPTPHTRTRQLSHSLILWQNICPACVLLCATMDICSDWIAELAHAWHIKQHIVR